MARKICPQRNRDREAGFTLMELLVACTMLALLMLVLAGGLRVGMRAWARGGAHAAAVDEVRRAQTLLRSAIEHAYPLYLSVNQARPHVDFEGRPRVIALLAPSPATLGGAGWTRVVFKQERRADSQDLTISAVPELAATDGSSQQGEPVLAGIDRIALDYFGSDSSSAKPVWQDNWAGRTSLPKLVRARVSFPEGDVRVWPELIVAPEIAVDANCIYDSLTKGCRGR